jgi:hypothetical protein
MRMFKDQEKLERLLKVLTNRYNGVASLRNLQRRNNYKPEEVRRLANVFPGRIIIKSICPSEKGGRPPEVVKIVA